MKKIGVAILGLGVVGGGTYRILTKQREFYRKTQNVDIEVVSVLEIDGERTKSLGVPAEKIATNIAEVVCNPDVNIIVECIGGVAAAKEYALAALNTGKSVVTSNAELYAKSSHELERAAKRHNAGLFFGASCVGGVPVVRTLLDGLQGDKISSLMGIVNGNSLSNVEDAAYRISILSSLAFHTKVPFSKVLREDMTGVSEEDISAAKQLGYTLKLLAVGKNTDAGIEVRVHPTFVKNDHPLAGVKEGFNAVFLEGDAMGEVMLYGRGTGSLPMGNAIVGDIIYAATHTEIKYSTFKNDAEEEKDVAFAEDYTSAYYLRLSVTDDAGALAKIASALGKCRISVAEMTRCQKAGDKACIVLVTYETHELAIKNAVEKINSTELAKVESVLRVVA